MVVQEQIFSLNLMEHTNVATSFAYLAWLCISVSTWAHVIHVSCNWKNCLLVSASEWILRFHLCCTYITIPEGIHILYISIFYMTSLIPVLSKGCFFEWPFSTPWKVQQMLFCLILSVVESQDLSNIQPNRENFFCAGLFDTHMVIWTLLDIDLHPNRDS